MTTGKMNRFNQRFLDKLKDKKGAMTILYVVLILTAILIINGFVIIFQMNMILNDAQGQMDVAGVSALRAAVDEVKLRDGTLEVDEAFAKNTFLKLLKDSNVFKSRQVVHSRVNVEIKNYIDGNLSQVGGASSVSGKKRPTYYLVAEAYLQFEATSIFDGMTMSTLSFYNFFDNAKDDISYSGRTEDGYYELVVRSVSRLVYR